MKCYKIIGLIGLLSVTNLANATVQGGISVTLAGTERHGMQIYVGISPNPSNCTNGGVYFRQGAELDNTLAVALSAKASNRTVRVDFDRNATSGFCTGFAIYME